MESCKLEIVLHSAKDLFDVKFFGTMDPYALLWITDGYGDLASTRYKTSVAEDAGCNPVWNSSMQFEVGSMKNSYILFCEINHDGTLFDRKIGEVRVPFTDLLSGNDLGEKVRYPVKLDTGEVVGKIILSHKFSNPAVMSSGANNTSNKVSGTSGDNDTNKVSAITGANNTSSQVSGTSGAKKTSKFKVSGTSGAKRTNTVSRTSGTKNRKPRKKVQGKSIGGLVKNIAIDVVSEALLSAVTTGITLAGEYMLHDTTHEGENNDEYEYEDEYEDDDEDEDKDEDAYEDEDDDEDAYEYEDEDEDEDEEEDDDDEDDDDDDDDDYDDDSE